KMDQRAWKNPYADYDGNPASVQELFDSQGKLTAEFAGRLSNAISQLLMHMENGLKSADPRDCTGYTGWAGIALLYLHLHGVFGEPSFLQKALDYVGHSLTCPTRRRDVTFLCGDAGPLAVAAVVYHRVQRAQESDECLSRLLQLHQSVVMGSGASGLPDELLYGRMGYLYALTFINQQFGHDKIPIQYIQQICEAVLISGEGQSQRFRCQDQSPLMYEWYQEQYVGPAHGLAGIYYFLMILNLKKTPSYSGKKNYVNPLEIPGYLHKLVIKYWCMNYGKHGCRTPDTPFSLFEGMAGTIYFLADLLQPLKSKFPAFEV
uniref:Glutathione S-transferase LANCL1 n=1 Tax=Hucho hucho TaxID=62062 RepID=A0A4W5P520_9TELE